MRSLILVPLLLLLLSSAFASQVLLFDPYGGNRIHNYYYICGCNTLANERAGEFESLSAFLKVFHSTNILCMGAIWCNYTPLVHQAASSLPPLAPVSKGMVVDDFVVPQDGFAFNTSIYQSPVSSLFVLFGPKRISNVDVLRRTKFPNFHSVVYFHRLSVARSLITKPHFETVENEDQVFIATKRIIDRSGAMSLKSLQTRLALTQTGALLYEIEHVESLKKILKACLPTSTFHLEKLDDPDSRLKLFFRHFKVIPPDSSVAMKYSPTKFEPTKAWTYKRYSTIVGSDMSDTGLASYFIALEFDRVQK